MPNVMAAQPNIGDALCESSVITFLVRRRKVWLTPAAGLPCNAANKALHCIACHSNFLGRSKTRDVIYSRCTTQ